MSDTYEAGFSLGADDLCPACGHRLAPDVHGNDGCEDGWAWDSEGIATTDGCECILMIAPGQRP